MVTVSPITKANSEMLFDAIVRPLDPLSSSSPVLILTAVTEFVNNELEQEALTKVRRQKVTLRITNY